VKTAICPACGQAGIVIAPNGRYSRGWPAKCRDCGALVYDRPHALVGAARTLIRLLLTPLLLAVLIFFPRTLWVAAAAVIVFVVIWNRRNLGRPRPETNFHVISAGNSRLSRRLTSLSILIVLAVVLAILAVTLHSK
jgi:hypothetical protein